jgi:uncharacterized membrane protein
MDSLPDDVTKSLEHLNAVRERFTIRAQLLPADLALVGLYNDLRDAASLVIVLCQIDAPVAAFPLARIVFEATQRIIALATEDDYVRVGTRAWLYYRRKDMRMVGFARGAETARE